MDQNEIRLLDVCEKITKGTTPTTLGNNFVSRGVSFVKVESISESGRILKTKLAYIDEQTNSLLARSILKENDILFTIAGTIGRVCIVPKGILPANTNQAVAIVRPKEAEIDYRFLYYVLSQPSISKAASSRVVQSVQANFSLAELGHILVPKIPKQRQRAIAHILGCLDDKIDLLRQINETLEAMARALFKSWFVDFDPVRRKADRKSSGLPPEMDKLFPDSFQNSELGEIPRGWDVYKLEDIIEINPLRSLAKGRMAVYLEMKNLPEKGMSPIGWERKEYGGGAKFKNGDTLFARITPCLENGKTAYIQFLSEEDEIAFGSTEYIVLASREGLLSEWCYLLARYEAFREYAIMHMNGSSGRQRVEKESLSRYKVAFPRDHSVAKAFKQQVSASFTMCKQNAEEILTLVSLRDSFLPKLISGELELNDEMIEKILEPAK